MENSMIVLKPEYYFRFEKLWVMLRNIKQKLKMILIIITYFALLSGALS